jgi:DNA replication and repair protein RecF
LLRLNTISILQFKNYREARFTFSRRVIGICGRNGVGKTNLLDAIYYLCFTKSYLHKSDNLNVHTGQSGFRIEGSFGKNGAENKVTCILRETGKKEFSMDEDLYTRLSAHIGKLPAVMIAPDDVELITGPSEARRRFIDTLICQLDAAYLQQLTNYNKVLVQRNSLLRSAGESGRAPDPALLQVYNTQLATAGTAIYTRRKDFFTALIPLVRSFYATISGAAEMVEVVYESQLHTTSFESLLQQNKEKDQFAQRTTGGIHRDDLGIVYETKDFKAYASQGQRKSLLFALRLAEFEMLQEAKGFPPLLLLDDVFEKLDDTRMQNLLRWVCLQNEAQVFITDTHANRLRDTLGKVVTDFQLVEL